MKVVCFKLILICCHILLKNYISGVERDLAALEDKVLTLGKEADRLCAIHGDHADQIQAKRAEIEAFWERLTAKAKVKT